MNTWCICKEICERSKIGMLHCSPSIDIRECAGTRFVGWQHRGGVWQRDALRRCRHSERRAVRSAGLSLFCIGGLGILVKGFREDLR